MGNNLKGIELEKVISMDVLLKAWGKCDPNGSGTINIKDGARFISLLAALMGNNLELTTVDSLVDFLWRDENLELEYLRMLIEEYNKSVLKRLDRQEKERRKREKPSALPIAQLCKQMFTDLSNTSNIAITIENQTFKNVFTGKTLVEWLKREYGTTENRALLIGEMMKRSKFIICFNEDKGRFEGKEELYRPKGDKDSVVQALRSPRVSRVQYVGINEDFTEDLTITKSGRKSLSNARAWIEFLSNTLEPQIVCVCQILCKDLYLLVSNNNDIWENVWNVYHTIMIPFNSEKGRVYQDALLLPQEEVIHAIDLSKPRKNMCNWKYIFLNYRWVKINPNPHLKDVTHYFKPFEKLVTGYGNKTSIEGCVKFKISGTLNLWDALLEPWIKGVLCEYMIWHKISLTHFNKPNMYIFSETSEQEGYLENFQLEREMRNIKPKTLEALMKHYLHYSGDSEGKTECILPSKDPSEAWVAFKNAMQQSFVPVEQIDKVIEFKGTYFQGGSLNVSFLLVAVKQGQCMLFNVKSDIEE